MNGSFNPTPNGATPSLDVLLIQLRRVSDNEQRTGLHDGLPLRGSVEQGSRRHRYRHPLTHSVQTYQEKFPSHRAECHRLNAFFRAKCRRIHHLLIRAFSLQRLTNLLMVVCVWPSSSLPQRQSQPPATKSPPPPRTIKIPFCCVDSTSIVYLPKLRFLKFNSHPFSLVEARITGWWSQEVLPRVTP